MARFSAVWGDTEATDWEEGDYALEVKFKEQFGQSLEYLAQLHGHAGAPGDGATLTAGNVLLIWAYGPPTGD
jgi:hypothetical protein